MYYLEVSSFNELQESSKAFLSLKVITILLKENSEWRILSKNEMSLLLSLKISDLILPYGKARLWQDRYNHELNWVPVFNNWGMCGFLFTHLASYSYETPILSCQFVISSTYCQAFLIQYNSPNAFPSDFCFTALSWFTLSLLIFLFPSPLPPLYSLILSITSWVGDVISRTCRALRTHTTSNRLWQSVMLISPQLHLQWFPVGSLKSISVEVYTPRKLENITNQGFFF